jgi:hypothetical protein
MATRIDATIFVLHGHGAELEIRREVEGVSVSFRNGSHKVSSSAQDTVVEETQLGTIATVQLESNPDGDNLSVTVLVPEVLLRNHSNQEPVSTQAIFVTTHGSIAGPGLLIGAVRTYSTLALHGSAYAPAPDSQEWDAGYTAAPNEPLQLDVRGRVTVPTPGYEILLRRHVPQGINPTDLLLDLVTVAPSGNVPQHVVTEDVRYVAPSDGGYKTVSILPIGVSVPIRPAK